MCISGSLKFSDIILNIEYRIKKHPEVYPALNKSFFLIAIMFIKINSTIPSKKAS